MLVKIVAFFFHSFLSLSFYKHLLYVENANRSVCTVISDDDMKYIIMLCTLKKKNCMCEYSSGNTLKKKNNIYKNSKGTYHFLESFNPGGVKS